MLNTFFNPSSSHQRSLTGQATLAARQVMPLARSEAAGAEQTPVSSAALLRGQKTVDITHNGMLYTLQATKLGKLILTK